MHSGSEACAQVLKDHTFGVHRTGVVLEKTTRIAAITALLPVALSLARCGFSAGVARGVVLRCGARPSLIGLLSSRAALLI